MLFYSLTYVFLFLPVVFAIFQYLKKIDSNYGKLWLLFASLGFYYYWKPEYISVLLGSIVINYYLSRCIVRLNGRKLLGINPYLALGIAFNVGLLGFFKYYNFFLGGISFALGANFSLLNYVLPLGISFFTFQQIAYLVDCSKGMPHTTSFRNYSLFVSFFPQLIAGPIVHHREMMPQFERQSDQCLDQESILAGLVLFSIGFFKKVMIADYVGAIANLGFGSKFSGEAVDAWIASLSYTFQLYYDFSGYTDMALGSALLFNIRLPQNFNSPYKSKSIQEFWATWHMTLSRWLKEYVYIPLGGNRCGRTRLAFNLMTTFLIGGIWHGAGWTFIVWGGLHGCATIIHRLWQLAGKYRFPGWLAWGTTFFFINLTWVFFRADSLTRANEMVKSMLGFGAVSMPQALESIMRSLFPSGTIDSVSFYDSPLPPDIAVVLPLIAFLTFFFPNSMQLVGIIGQQRERLSTLLVVFCSILFLCTSWMLIAGDASESTFIYFNF